MLKPEEPSEPSDQTDSAVKTGDVNNSTFVCMLMFLSFSGIWGMVKYKKRKRNQKLLKKIAEAVRLQRFFVSSVDITSQISKIIKFSQKEVKIIIYKRQNESMCNEKVKF